MLQQGRIRLVLTGTLTGDDEIAEHHKRHGDGVISIALSVPDAAAAYEHAVSHGARGIRTPYELTDEHGTVRLASVATYGETQHVFVDRADYDGAVPARLRGARRALTAAPTACWSGSTTSSATSSSATWRSGFTTTSACSG